MVLPVDAVNFHLAVFGVKLHTQCTSNTFIETDVYDYVQWWTEILRQAHLHGDWCSKQSVYKHQTGGRNEARTGPNLYQWVRLHVMHSQNSCLWSLNWKQVRFFPVQRIMTPRAVNLSIARMSIVVFGTTSHMFHSASVFDVHISFYVWCRWLFFWRLNQSDIL